MTDKRDESMLNKLERILEITGKTAAIVAAVCALIWGYKEGTLFKDVFITIVGILMLLGPLFILNRNAHNAICKELLGRFPYIIYLIPIVVLWVLIAHGTAESAYLGFNSALLK